VIASLTKYEIAFDESEDADALRTKLAQFYAKRTLTKAAITPEDQAEAVFFLASNRAAKITGQVLPVDGGLREAFVR
jgi:NAD(P)-dependent dehydrogenase (short-subunit alcohol dehydrogenase family)